MKSKLVIYSFLCLFLLAFTHETVGFLSKEAKDEMLLVTNDYECDENNEKDAQDEEENSFSDDFILLGENVSTLSVDFFNTRHSLTSFLFSHNYKQVLSPPPDNSLV